MWSRHKSLFIVFAFGSMTLGCQRIALWTYGIRDYKDYQKEDYRHFTRKFDQWKLVGLDTSMYFELLDKHNLSDKIDHYPLQPLQIKVYNRSDSLILWAVNCMTGGYPNLNWERIGHFDQFPFKSKYINVADSVSAWDQGQYVTEENEAGVPDYTVDVYLSIMMGRQTKRLLKLVDRAIEEHGGEWRIRKRLVPSDKLMEKI